MLSKKEIEENNTLKISMPLITDEDIRRIDNNFETIVKEFTKSYVKEKDLVLAQYVMQKQQDKIDQLESDKQKLIDKLEKANREDTESVKYYEKMRRSCQEDSFYKKSYQTQIHKLNAKREVRRNILSILKG
ncbi:MAG: hypothetical protein ACI4UU_00600 [Clostridia bacterium]